MVLRCDRRGQLSFHYGMGIAIFTLILHGGFLSLLGTQFVFNGFLQIVLALQALVLLLLRWINDWVLRKAGSCSIDNR